MSNSNTHLIPNQAPPVPKQLNGEVNASTSFLQPPALNLDSGVDINSNTVRLESLNSPGRLSLLEQFKQEPNSSLAGPSGPCNNESTVSIDATTSFLKSTSVENHDNTMSVVQTRLSSPSSASAPSHGSSTSQLTSRKITTFRRLHPKKSMTQSPMQARLPSTPSSPLAVSVTERNVVAVPAISEPTPQVSSMPASPIIPAIELSPAYTNRPTSQAPTLHLMSQLSPSISLDGDAVISERSSASSPPSSRKAAPYRPGFQPRGLYRPLTDEFLAARKLKRDGDSASNLNRIERTKLERRLEKLISLHFPHSVVSDVSKEGMKRERRPNLSTIGRDKNRASSFFDFQSFGRLNINHPSEIWKGVIIGGLGSTKADIRGGSLWLCSL